MGSADCDIFALERLCQQKSAIKEHLVTHTSNHGLTIHFNALIIYK